MYRNPDNNTGREHAPYWRNPYTYVILVGIVFFLGAYILHLLKIEAFVSIIVSSIGASLIATSIAAWLALRGSRFVEHIIAVGVISVFLERDKDIPATQWTELIRQAKRQCNILGIALHGWAEDEYTEPAIRECVAREVPIKILFLNPDSNAAMIRQQEESAKRDTVHEIKHAITRFWEMKENLPPEQQNFLNLCIYDNTPSCSIIWTDKQMVVTNYVVSVPNVRSPGVIISDVSKSIGLFVKLKKDKRCLFDVYRDNFNTVLRASQELTRELVEKYKTDILKEV